MVLQEANSTICWLVTPKDYLGNGRKNLLIWELLVRSPWSNLKFHGKEEVIFCMLILRFWRTWSKSKNKIVFKHGIKNFRCEYGDIKSKLASVDRAISDKIFEAIAKISKTKAVPIRNYIKTKKTIKTHEINGGRKTGVCYKGSKVIFCYKLY